MDDLWGDLPNVDDIRTPYAILLEQATLLTKKTRGMLTGSVSRTQDGVSFVNRLGITAPALNNYAYSVCAIQHEIALYPVIFSGTAINPNSWERINDEPGLVERLRKELTASYTQRVIAGLLAQIRADQLDKPT